MQSLIVGEEPSSKSSPVAYLFIVKPITSVFLDSPLLASIATVCAKLPKSKKVTPGPDIERMLIHFPMRSNSSA